MKRARIGRELPGNQGMPLGEAHLIHKDVFAKLHNQLHNQVSKIISGGQNGAERGGLIAARDLGIQTGGTAPKGWLAEDGSQAQFFRNLYMVECDDPTYPSNLEANVLNSGGTLLVGRDGTGLNQLVDQIDKRGDKPVFHLIYPVSVHETVERQPGEFRFWLRLHWVQHTQHHWRTPANMSRNLRIYAGLYSFCIKT